MKLKKQDVENVIKELQYLESKAHQPLVVSMRVLCRGRIGMWSVGFCGGRRTRELREKPSEQGKNTKLNPLMAPGRNQTPAILVGPRRALSPLRQPCYRQTEALRAINISKVVRNIKQ